MNKNVEFILNIVESLPNELSCFIKENCFLAGGAIYSIHNRQKVNDYDFYFYNKEKIVELKSLIKKLNIYLNNETKWAITFNIKGSTFQFITKNFGQPRDVVSKFDFYHCMNYFEFKNNFISYSKKYEPNVLMFNTKCVYPFRSLERLQKFIQRGFTIKSSELIKIALAINIQKIENVEKLKDQCEGMYISNYDLNNLEGLYKEFRNIEFKDKL